MTDFAAVKGRKGGKGGGGGRAPKESPDNLLTDSTAYVIDVVSEGEIEGWADPENPGKCIFFDGTPLQNPDGTFNFEGVEYWLRVGTPDQPHVPGFSAVEAETPVGVEVKDSQPVARSVSSADVDAVRVKVGLGQLSNLDTKTGDLKGSSVTFAIDIQAGDSEWLEVGEYTITGKTTSGYQRGYRVELPQIRPVSLRVRRVTPEPEKSNIQNAIYFVSMTEIIDAKLSYPNTAYVALAVPAQAFGGQIPRRSYLLKGMRCFVPSNYDPETRQYDESAIWDGTFKLAYTDNPAFFTYTVYVQDRWGLGERISPALVDKWRIYQIGKYCDGLVPDGLGGSEPRFTINGVINTREAAYDVITKLSATFRGVTYWGAGAVVPVQDAPSDPVKLVTNANVIDGDFSYSGTALAARKTAAIGSFRHPDNHYKIAAGVVYEDPAGVQRYGRRQLDVTNPFQTSRGGALRECRWLVDTNLRQTETVSYQAGLDHAAIRPGDRVLIADKARTAFRSGGRIMSISADRQSVELDAPVSLVAGEAHSLMLTDELGGFVSLAVASIDAGSGGGVSNLELSDPVPAGVRAGAVFVVTASDLQPKLFRVLSNKPKGHLFSIMAVSDDLEKFDRVESGIRTDDDAPHILPTVGPVAVPSDITAVFYLRPDPGSVSKLRLLVSWKSFDPLVFKFLVRVKEPGGAWRDVGETRETSFEYVPDSADAGDYVVRVFGVTALGDVSPPGEVVIAYDGLSQAPSVPTGWSGVSGFDSITLFGDPQTEADFKAFVIYGATDESSELVRLDEVSTTRYVRRVDPADVIARYAVTAINHSGVESLPTPFIPVLPKKPVLTDLDPSVSETIVEVADSAATAAVVDFRDTTFAETTEQLAVDHQAAVQAAIDAGNSATASQSERLLAETARAASASTGSGNLLPNGSMADVSLWAMRDTNGYASFDDVWTDDVDGNGTPGFYKNVPGYFWCYGTQNVLIDPTRTYRFSVDYLRSGAIDYCRFTWRRPNSTSSFLSVFFYPNDTGVWETETVEVTGATIANVLVDSSSSGLVQLGIALDHTPNDSTGFIKVKNLRLEDVTAELATAANAQDASDSAASAAADAATAVSASETANNAAASATASEQLVADAETRTWNITQDPTFTAGLEAVGPYATNGLQIDAINSQYLSAEPSTDPIYGGMDVVAQGHNPWGTRQIHPVVAGRTWRLKARAKLDNVVEGVSPRLYFGVRSRYADGVGIANHYLLAANYTFESGTVVGQWVDFEVDFTVADIHPSAVYFNLLCFAGYGASSEEARAQIMRVSYFELIDVTEEVAAESYAASAQISADSAASASTTATDAAATAVDAKDIAVQVYGQAGGLIPNQFDMSAPAWEPWNAGAALLPADVYAGGTTAYFNVGSTSFNGVVANAASSITSGWVSVPRTDQVRVEMEIELLSGGVDGAGLLVDWYYSSGSPIFDRVAVRFDEMYSGPIPLGERVALSALVDRDTARDPATLNFLRIYLMANYNGDLGPMSAKSFKVHRFQVFPMTAVEAAIKETATAVAQVGENLDTIAAASLRWSTSVQGSETVLGLYSNLNPDSGAVEGQVYLKSDKFRVDSDLSVFGGVIQSDNFDINDASIEGFQINAAGPSYFHNVITTDSLKANAVSKSCVIRRESMGWGEIVDTSATVDLGSGSCAFDDFSVALGNHLVVNIGLVLIHEAAPAGFGLLRVRVLGVRADGSEQQLDAYYVETPNVGGLSVTRTIFANVGSVFNGGLFDEFVSMKIDGRMQAPHGSSQTQVGVKEVTASIIQLNR